MTEVKRFRTLTDELTWPNPLPDSRAATRVNDGATTFHKELKAMIDKDARLEELNAERLALARCLPPSRLDLQQVIGTLLWQSCSVHSCIFERHAQHGQHASRRYVVKWKLVLAGVTVLVGVGCLPKNAFAPPPDDWEIWRRADTDQATLWKDMLECGYATPYPTRRIGREGFTIEKHVATLRCMESLGYGYTQDWRVVPVCEATGLRSSSSCLPGADVPVPSARLRLEGRYCAAFPSSVACSP